MSTARRAGMRLITDLAWVNNKSSQADTDSEWQWHQLGHMQVCTSLQIDNHASTPPLSFFTGHTPFLSPNQQRQSTEGTKSSQADFNN